MLFREDIIAWFGEFERLRSSLKIKPELLFNMDETMLRTVRNLVKVFTRSTDPQPVLPQEEMEPEHISLLLTISAAGEAFEPLAILPLKTVPPLSQDLHRRIILSGQTNGWLEGQTFNGFVFNHIVPRIQDVRRRYGHSPLEPALLVFDGASTHTGLDVERLRERYNIHTIMLPAHSSTILQPLDLSVIGVFKHHLTQRWEWKPHESLPMRRLRLLSVALDCLDVACSRLFINDGWRRAGLQPVDVDVALCSPLVLRRAKAPAQPKPKRGKLGPPMDKGRTYFGETTFYPPPKKAKIDTTPPRISPPQPTQWYLKSSHPDKIVLSRV